MRVTLVVAALCVATVYSNVVVQPKHTVTKDWYETATFYQIYPRSFYDSDGNGVGDIRGIIEKLPYLKEMGITGTWLSPVFKSPMADFGYDISNFYEIDETFGTMQDMVDLFKAANATGIKVILDFVPNHSSEHNEWFQKSIKREGIYTDYYIWHDGKNVTVDGVTTRVRPNNWVSVFNTYAWTFNEERGQYYFHQFAKEQPDLNFRNPLVVKEMQNVLKFWLGRGAAGFRVDAINHLFEDELLRDEPVNPEEKNDQSFGYTYKIYTKNQPETYDVVFDWRSILDQFQKDNGGETRIMMTEAYANQEETIAFYGDGKRLGAHMPFNFVLIEELNEQSTADQFLNVISSRLAAIPEGRVTNWVMGNHDQPRVGTRYGRERIDALMTLVMTLPGIAVTYQGEEIGMVDNRDITFEQTVDPPGRNAGKDNFKWISRDPVRTPFQWDDSRNAGFSNGTANTWLPVHPNYKWLNVKNQRAFSRSSFKYYKQLMQLRQDHVLIDGTFEPKVVGGNVLTYIRSLAGHGEYLVLINFAEHEMNINVQELTSMHFNGTTRMEVVLAGADSNHSPGDLLDKNKILLRKFDAVILKSSATSVTISLTVLLVAFARFIVA